MRAGCPAHLREGDSQTVTYEFAVQNNSDTTYMVDAMSIPWMTGVEVATAIREKKVSCLEVLDALLDRIHRLDRPTGNESDRRINSVVVLYEEYARSKAIAADAALSRGESWGPLHGVPMTIKECNFWGKTPATNGDPANVRPPVTEKEDIEYAAGHEPLVRRLLDAGAIIFGKVCTILITSAVFVKSLFMSEIV